MAGRNRKQFSSVYEKLGLNCLICRLLRGEIAVCCAIMFEKIKVQLPAAQEKVAHLRRFL
jgi:hypothetical protein